MPRNLDIAALRAFAAVIAAGGVTRAAAQLNLTQSAVSMQLKRLETALGQRLLRRDGRGVALTPAGEVALGYARRACALNDELIDRMREDAPAGELRLGVPHDIVAGVVPRVLRAFAAEYPRVRVALDSGVTARLLAAFAEGALDIVIGTEATAGPGGREIVRLPLVWAGGPGGVAWRARPLPLAFERDCVFRGQAQAALEAAGIPWENAVIADQSRAIDVSVGADLAVHVVLAGFLGPETVAVAHGGALPEPGEIAVTLYERGGAADPARARLVELLSRDYAALAAARAPRLAAG